MNMRHPPCNLKTRLPILLAIFASMSVSAPAQDLQGFVTNGIEKATPGDFQSDSNGLASGGYSLTFPQGSGGLYGIEIAGSGAMLFHQPKPVEMTIRGNSIGNLATLAEGYASIRRCDYGIAAQTSVRTVNGSEFTVYDLWFVVSEGNFGLSRNVTVVSADGRDVGFSSAIKIMSASNSGTINDYEITLPSILYRDAQGIPGSAIGSNLNVPSLFVKETRMGMPYILVRDKAGRNSVLLAHYQPEVTVNGVVGGGAHGEVNVSLQYGAFGFTNNGGGLNAGYVYPCTEGPQYYWGSGWITRFHPVRIDVKHQYKVNIIPTAKMDSKEAFTYSTLKAYGKGSAPLFELDLEALYASSIRLLNTVYLETGTGNLKAAGLPFAVPLDEARRTTFYDPSMQMGFVGAQTSLAAQMIKHGYKTGDNQLIERGRKMIDFWTSAVIYPSSNALPFPWWDRFENASGGAPRRTKANNIYPAFLRIICDGMDGIMEAHKFMRIKGETPPQPWMASVLRVAEFFKTKQESDGSLRRAYDASTGQINADTSEPVFQGGSKLNTAIAVPFFYKVSDYFEGIGNHQKAQEFASAAKRAADYVYDNIYMPTGKYVGGTPDNPNVVDKEAGIYATRAFASAYIATGDGKYLAAAEHAACYVLTFIYTYDFAVNSRDATVNRYNPFKTGGASGFSLIATGHSGADLFSSYTVYDFYKLYVLTGKPEYRDIAVFVQNNSKQAVDYDGRLGYLYKGTSPEASGLADFDFGTVSSPGIWLPWNTDACIRPMSDIELLFGRLDIRQINLDLNTQRSILARYGLGGKMTAVDTRIAPPKAGLSSPQADIRLNAFATVLEITAAANARVMPSKIFNSSGHAVMVLDGAESRRIDISALPNGLYILNMHVDGRFLNKEFVKQ